MSATHTTIPLRPLQIDKKYFPIAALDIPIVIDVGRTLVGGRKRCVAGEGGT